jgi:hypothetical protein
MPRIASIFRWLPLASLVVLQTGISHERALTRKSRAPSPVGRQVRARASDSGLESRSR